LIAIDTSAFARYLDGLEDRSTMMVERAMRGKIAILPPVVVTELLSNPAMPEEARAEIVSLNRLTTDETYWERAGILRAALRRAGVKAHLADCLIAQACIDNDAPLITYDRDFRHFESAGLKLI